MEFDTSQVDAFAAHLGRVGAGIVPAAGAILEKGALNIKNGMAQDFTNVGDSPHGTVPFLPRAIDYDVRGLEAEIGVNKSKKQGPLASILAYGTSTQPALVDHTASLRRELPNLEKFLGELGEQAL